MQPIPLIATLADACGADPTTVCRFVYDAFENDTLARVADLMMRPLKAILILVAAWILNRIVRRTINRTVARLVADQEAKAEEALVEAPGRLAALGDRALVRAQRLADHAVRGKQRANTLGAILRSIAAIVIYTIAVMLVLGEFDVNLGPLIASAGIVGVALGFGAQSLVKDFLSGIFMLVEDQFGVGDIVDLGEASGIVEAVNLRTTKLRDVHGTLWHVPNGEVRRVGNKSQIWARVIIDADVAYDTDVDLASRIVKEVADEVWREQPPKATILEEPEVWGLERFGENAITIRLAAKVEPAEQWSTARIIRARLKKAFDAAGIEIPFPQRTLWIRSDGDASPAPTPPADEPSPEDVTGG
jgi:moderate conductance mechanosensitive channel